MFQFRSTVTSWTASKSLRRSPDGPYTRISTRAPFWFRLTVRLATACARSKPTAVTQRQSAIAAPTRYRLLSIKYCHRFSSHLKNELDLKLCNHATICYIHWKKGHYACLCPKGHYGTGIKDDCHRKSRLFPLYFTTLQFFQSFRNLNLSCVWSASWRREIE